MRNAQAVGLDLNSVAVETPKGAQMLAGEDLPRGEGWVSTVRYLGNRQWEEGGEKTHLDLKKKKRQRSSRKEEQEK